MITGKLTGERTVDRIPIKTLLLGYKDEFGLVLDFLRENKDYAYSILCIRKTLFPDMTYGDCQVLLRKIYESGLVHRHKFINVVYYFTKY